MRAFADRRQLTDLLETQIKLDPLGQVGDRGIAVVPHISPGPVRPKKSAQLPVNPIPDVFKLDVSGLDRKFVQLIKGERFIERIPDDALFKINFVAPV